MTDDAAIVIPAPMPVHVERTLVTDSPMVDSKAHTVAVETTQPPTDAIALDVTPAYPTPVESEPSPTQPKEGC